MTNSEVVQFIISKLENSSITWKGDKELFELIFAPIPYGNEIEKRQKEIKRSIFDIFQDIDKFDKIKFNKLVRDISCGDQKRHKKQIITFLEEEIIRLKITTDADIKKLVSVIPCKNSKEKNYRTQFAHWKKKGATVTIHDRSIKNALQKNFYFESDLWSMEDAAIKQILQKGIDTRILLLN